MLIQEKEDLENEKLKKKNVDHIENKSEKDVFLKNGEQDTLVVANSYKNLYTYVLSFVSSGLLWTKTNRAKSDTFFSRVIIVWMDVSVGPYCWTNNHELSRM